MSLNARAIPEPVWQKPEALKVGEYYLNGNVHENLTRMGDCQACRSSEVALFLHVPMQMKGPLNEKNCACPRERSPAEIVQVQVSMQPF
jgi:hypothetical protein